MPWHACGCLELQYDSVASADAFAREVAFGFGSEMARPTDWGTVWLTCQTTSCSAPSCFQEAAYGLVLALASMKMPIFDPQPRVCVCVCVCETLDCYLTSDIPSAERQQSTFSPHKFQWDAWPSLTTQYFGAQSLLGETQSSELSGGGESGDLRIQATTTRRSTPPCRRRLRTRRRVAGPP